MRSPDVADANTRLLVAAFWCSVAADQRMAVEFRAIAAENARHFSA